MEVSLRDELGEALDQIEPEVPIEVKSEPVEVAPEKPVETAKQRDETGKFVPKVVEKTEKIEEAKPTEQIAKPEIKPEEIKPDETADTKSLVTPPATWSAAAKSIYASLPETARKEIAKREQDYARGIQQHAEAAKGYQAMMAEFQPYEAMIRAENGTPQGAIRDLLKTSYLLRTGTPQERGNLVMQIAQRFGADLTPYLGQKEETGQQEFMPQVQQYVQQLVSPHLQRIQQFEESQLTAQQRQMQEMQQETQSQIEAFQNATAEDGSPKHVYFENVRPLMSSYFASGQAQTLEQAYEMACWANPEVRAALIADQQRASEAQRLEEAKRKAKEAKSSSFNVTGQGGVGISGSTQTSLRDELAAQFEGDRV